MSVPDKCPVCGKSDKWIFVDQQRKRDSARGKRPLVRFFWARLGLLEEAWAVKKFTMYVETVAFNMNIVNIIKK